VHHWENSLRLAGTQTGGCSVLRAIQPLRVDKGPGRNAPSLQAGLDVDAAAAAWGRHLRKSPYIVAVYIVGVLPALAGGAQKISVTAAC
jgi:hypothetical protein